MIKFLDLKKQYSKINIEIDGAIKNVINNTAFIGGKYLKKFEEDFAKYQNSKYCIGVANGTDGLEIVLEALNLPKNSEVLVPANSFISTAEAVTRAGHKVVFCDCDKDNYTISIPSLLTKITKKTRAIIVVHLYGHPCDMDKILSIAKRKKLKVIEDCAQAHGAEYKAKKIGTLADAGVFSFYPGKNLGAFGDGGAITTNNSSLERITRMISNHGRVKKYEHEFEGRNSRLDGIQAAILSVKLKYLDNWTDIRINMAEEYFKNLKNISNIILPKKEEWAKHVYHLYVIRTNKREELKSKLFDKNIETGVHYPTALPKLKAYRYLKQFNEKFFANKFDSELLSLPMGEHLKKKEIQFVCKQLANFFNN